MTPLKSEFRLRIKTALRAHRQLLTWMILLLLLSVAGACLRASFLDVRKYGGVDLRARVTGARLLVAGRDPYRVGERPSDERFIDPLQTYPGLSRVTYQPTLLLMYAPLSPLAYRIQRWAWFALEWLAMAALGALSLCLLQGRRDRLLFLLIFICGFVASNGWRLHVERGQWYVFLAMLTALFARLVRRGANDVASGLVLGLVVALRPTMVSAILLLLIVRRRRFMPTLAATTAGGVTLATLWVAKPSVWSHYSEVISHYSQFGWGGQSAHAIVEGVEVGPMLAIPYSNVSLPNLLRHIADWSNVAATCLPAIPPILVVLLLTLAGMTLRLTTKHARDRVSLVTVLAVAFLIDWALAPYRNSYGEVLYVPLVALLLPLWTRSRSGFTAIALVGVGLVIGCAPGILRSASLATNAWVRFVCVLGPLVCHLGYTLGRRLERVRRFRRTTTSLIAAAP